MAVSSQCLRVLIEAGKLDAVGANEAARGEGKRADETRNEIRRLQAAGSAKADIARKLGVAIRTVDRHWDKWACLMGSEARVWIDGGDVAMPEC